LLDEQIQVRKVEYEGLQATLKTNQAKLKDVLSKGESNESLADKLKAAKAAVADLEGKLAPFLSSGAKLVTEVELAKAEKECKKH